MCFKAGKVERFCLDPSLGEFIHTHSDVQFPADGGKKIYSCNGGARNARARGACEPGMRGHAQPCAARMAL